MDEEFKGKNVKIRLYMYIYIYIYICNFQYIEVVFPNMGIISFLIIKYFHILWIPHEKILEHCNRMCILGKKCDRDSEKMVFGAILRFECVEEPPTPNKWQKLIQ